MDTDELLRLVERLVLPAPAGGRTPATNRHTAATWALLAPPARRVVAGWFLQHMPVAEGEFTRLAVADVQQAVARCGGKWPAGAVAFLNHVAHLWTPDSGGVGFTNKRAVRAAAAAVAAGHSGVLLTPTMQQWCGDDAWRRDALVAIGRDGRLCQTSRHRAQLEFMRVARLLGWSQTAAAASLTFGALQQALRSLPREHRDTRFMCNVLAAVRSCRHRTFPLLTDADGDRLYIKAMAIVTQQSHGGAKRRRWSAAGQDDELACSSEESDDDQEAAGRLKALSTDAMDRLYRHAADSLSNEERLVFVLLTTLALRVTGVVHLRWNGVLLEEEGGMSLSFRDVGHSREKGGKMRGFVVHDALRDALLAHLHDVDAMGFTARPVHVFCGLSAGHTHRSKRWVNGCVSRWARDAKVGVHVHPHMFRHTLITDLVTKMHNSVDLVAKFIDHSSSRMTMRYVTRPDAPAIPLGPLFGMAAASSAAALHDAVHVCDDKNTELEDLLAAMTEEELALFIKESGEALESAAANTVRP